MSLKDKLELAEISSKLTLWILLIVFGIIAAVVIGASVWANVAEGRTTSNLPDMPAISKAQYTVKIKVTGEVLLTDKYDTEKSLEAPSKQVYTLHGFYRLVDNKWQWAKVDIFLDEFYWGDIKIEKRR